MGLEDRALAALKISEQYILQRQNRHPVQKINSFASFVSEELEKIADLEMQSEAKWEIQCVLRKYTQQHFSSRNGKENLENRCSTSLSECSDITTSKNNKVEILSIERIPPPSPQHDTSTLFSLPPSVSPDILQKSCEEFDD